MLRERELTQQCVAITEKFVHEHSKIYMALPEPGVYI